MEDDATAAREADPRQDGRGPRLGRRERWWAIAVCASILGLVALPGLRLLADDEAPDGFPSSTYPMFSDDPGRVVGLPAVVAVDQEGRVERLSPETIAGTDQVIQASVTVRNAISDGAPGAQALCRRVAARVDGPLTVAVVVETHDAIRWAADHATDPLDRRIVASCEASG